MLQLRTNTQNILVFLMLFLQYKLDKTSILKWFRIYLSQANCFNVTLQNLMCRCKYLCLEQYDLHYHF